jgi:hypothetical protein
MYERSFEIIFRKFYFFSRKACMFQSSHCVNNKLWEEVIILMTLSNIGLA